MPDQFTTGKGQPSEQDILSALRQQGINNLNDLVTGAVQHIKAETAAAGTTPTPDFWLLYNDGKYGLVGPT